MQGEEDSKGGITGLIVTARAQLYALEQTLARRDVELVHDFSRRLVQTANAIRSDVILEFPPSPDADYAGAAEPTFHFRV